MIYSEALQKDKKNPKICTEIPRVIKQLGKQSAQSLEYSVKRNKLLFFHEYLRLGVIYEYVNIRLYFSTGDITDNTRSYVSFIVYTVASTYSTHG